MRSEPFWNGPVLRPVAYGAPGASALPPARVVDGSGMSGGDGHFHLHDDDHGAMWMTVDHPGDRNWIAFDFGRIEPLGAMSVWNFNQGSGALSGPGLRDVRLFTSVDGAEWVEFLGPGHPYRFARADGSRATRPTGLEGGDGFPVDLCGVAARFLKVVPDPLPAVGCWEGYIENQVRFGLAEVRFSRYRPPAGQGRVLPFLLRSADDFEGLDAVASGLGLSDPWSPFAAAAVHSSASGTMALSGRSPRFGILEFEFDGVYPISEMHVWNYNEPEQTESGLRDVRIHTSLDGDAWMELPGSDGAVPLRFAKAEGTTSQKATNLDAQGNPPVRFHGTRARFVRLSLSGGVRHGGVWGMYNRSDPRYGLSKVVFIASEGLCAEPRRDWSAVFSRYEGWSGADGIFTFSVDGRDSAPESDESMNRKTLVVFSDTMIGSTDPVTRVRRRNFMVNNTAALLEGTGPDDLTARFLYGRKAAGTLDNLFPTPDGKPYYYWLQDGVVLGDRFHVFSVNIVFDPTQPAEGFQFKSLGVDLLSVAMVDGVPDFDRVSSIPSPLFDDGLGLWFGGAVMANTVEAGAPDPDGYLYVYGMVRDGLFGSICVARVEPVRIEDFSAWRFFDGKGFVADIRAIVPIVPIGSCECSVTPIRSGPWKGRYAYVGIPIGIGSVVDVRLGDTPFGPFTEKHELFFIPEAGELAARGANRVYTYNAKAHPHLSDPGALLVSYNINATDFNSHFLNADVYHPRFQQVRFL